MEKRLGRKLTEDNLQLKVIGFVCKRSENLHFPSWTIKRLGMPLADSGTEWGKMGGEHYFW